MGERGLREALRSMRPGNLGGEGWQAVTCGAGPQQNTWAGRCIPGRARRDISHSETVCGRENGLSKWRTPGLRPGQRKEVALEAVKN